MPNVLRLFPCYVLGILGSATMPKRKFQKYHNGAANYGNKLRLKLSSSSDGTRKVVASSVRETLKVHNTDHLIVRERFDVIEGGYFDLNFYHPVRLMQFVIDHCPSLARHYGQQAMLSNEWNLLIGYDEQTPGSEVNSNNMRKNFALVMNVLEAGADYLQRDETWYVPLIMRAHVFGSISGGCSTVLRRFLRRAFVDPGNFGESGILVPRPDGNVAQIKIKMKTMLTDGEGHQKTLEWNGPASLRPNFYFANVWKLDSGMEGGGDVEIDCSDRSLMRKWDRDRWYSNIDAVLDARRRHGNGEMTQAELNRPDKAERQGLADPSAASALTVQDVPDLDRRPAGRCVLRSFGSERHAWHAWLSMQSPERRSEQGLLQRLEGVTDGGG